MTIIRRDVIKAALQFVPKKDVRYYLVGVHVAAGRIEATDGCILFAHKCDAPAGTDCIIPRDVCETITKATKVHEWTLTANPSGKWTLADDVGGASIVFAPVDGRFPDCARATPRMLSGELAAYDPDLLARVKKAASEIGAKHVGICHNGTGAAVMPINDDAFALVMPMRGMLLDKADAALAVTWIHSAAEQTAVAA
jgi:hypothetical protein